jgi:hypothetical protein
MISFYLLILVLGLPSLSWGYVDPGSISIFVQLIVAFVVGAVISLRTLIASKLKYISNLFIGKKKTNYEKK